MMERSNRIRIVVVDDLAVIRSGLRLFLMAFDDLELCGEAGSGEDAIQLCSYVRPDVVVMDLVMPGMGGIVATHVIKNRYPHTQIVALTSSPQSDLIDEILQAGAISCLMKDLSALELANAIRAAHAGKPTLVPEVTQNLDSGEPLEPVCTLGLGNDLTEREWQVLTLIVEGLNNADIAERLVVSRSTVKFHISSIFSKLGVENRAEAVAVTLQNRLIARRPRPPQDYSY
jgi:NarL family two-component system response regulator LiaR